jgi:hypothetical protein
MSDPKIKSLNGALPGWPTTNASARNVNQNKNPHDTTTPPKGTSSHPQGIQGSKPDKTPTTARDEQHPQSKPDKPQGHNRPDLLKTLENEGAQARDRLTRAQQRSTNPSSSPRQPDDAANGGKKGKEKARSVVPDSQRTGDTPDSHDAHDAKADHVRNSGGRSLSDLPDGLQGKEKQLAKYATREAARDGDNSRHAQEVSLSALLKYVNGGEKDGDLPRSLQKALDVARSTIGSDSLSSLLETRGRKLEKFAAHFLEQSQHLLQRPGEAGHSTPKELVKRAVDDLVGVVQLVKHFAELGEKGGGKVVQRAEEKALRFLFNEARRETGDQGGDRSGLSRGATPVVRPSELLRDLRAGLFLPAQEAHNPFPLSGRARIASEMMELMRTLDVIDQFGAKLETLLRSSQRAEVFAPAHEGLAGERASVGLGGELEGLLMMLPGLPGPVGRSAIERFIAALGGQLVDLKGRTLVAEDGTPLKLDQLLWLGAAGGLVGGRAADAELYPTRLSPLLVHGFDALYSLIGFDGRTLAAPRYAAVQVQINSSELEWIFGQPPLSEGWLRALIERLKDSRATEHNYLGEMLEDALVDRRFHSALLSATVTDGAAVQESFTVSKLLSGASEGFSSPAFAPA